ncbi:bifunctional lysylphosphatidylglycerol flippase/synthetase MprF [Listeria booriae]|uniref:Bifunctional lysylphosphatidylglycerol flippase/synthetase MprF n=1 Tax=Listeria booriae TaxID=1552123 RepID=A0A7X0Z9P7_9LIST|nr:bifunctional lysylphosphatidylglycerol flippase/synthetase MprF [Listeria booriae]MBC1212089.1 bifunctional lysylphosphatidylglycerol flippase/synthetase MprF [Listeria booriae]MBC1228398.1 bifunctional lysylphosphatidylglycerol flippase/synthetase MprF [Listeria booriae]MBC1231830.1 bifunctional lysylphosphatidylglycerol flippase/synthetase MprF [Listeria booriae]MBC1318189.1 bifunctional lysylphosphatidylglycerol flippase/synthetase MprF [Listeria booriae]MBC1333242.1 bifunctional lysylph
MKERFAKIVAWFQQNSLKVKIIFVLFVLAFVAYEIISIGTTTDFGTLKENLTSQSPQSILIMIIVGLIAVTPMLLYDFVIVKLLPGKFPISHIITSGWITNTFTNIGGFGGVLGASLRASFYGKNANHKQILLAISKIALFLVSGLSIYCLVGLVTLFIPNFADHFRNYWPWLLAGGLYFPVLFIITKWKSKTLFEDLPLKRELLLILASLLEWAFAFGCFVIIGVLMNEPVDVAKIFPLFVIASVIGIASMVPGGVGTFDVVMILGLEQLGVSTELSVAWLLFYRIFYYIIPFAAGLLFFVQKAGKKFNDYLEGLPRLFLQKLAHRFLVLFVYFSGLMLIISAAIPNAIYHLPLLYKLAPFSFFFVSQITMIAFGFLLLGLARGIESKVTKAYVTTIVVLGCAIFNTLAQGFSVKAAIFLGIVLFCVYLARNEFYREKLVYTWSKIIFDSALFLVCLVGYVVIGIYNSPRVPHHKKIPDFLLIPSEHVWITGFIGVAIAVISLIVIFYYFSGKNITIGEPFDARRLRKHLAQYKGNEVTHTMFLRDKLLFWSKDDKLLFPFKVAADKMVIMGEPVGDPDYLEEALEELMTYADRYGYRPVFYEVDVDMLAFLHDHGFDFMKIGEEGFVSLPEFTLTGKKRKGERALMNKFEREGYTFEIIHPSFDDRTIQRLRDISDDWLDGRTEKGFSLGFFDVYYLEQAPVAIAKDAEGEIIAFASMMPCYNDEMTSIDLMRYGKDAPSGIMDFLFINLFQHGQAEGYQIFNAGMAPLSNVGSSQFAFLGERLAGLVYRYSQGFYGFQGLRNYKSKYVTTWVQKFVAFRKRSSIAFTMLQLMVLVGKKRPLSKAQIIEEREEEILEELIAEEPK